ncbi:hypothetical protein J3E61_001459 [Mycobacterium sp. OAE908]
MIDGPRYVNGSIVTILCAFCCAQRSSTHTSHSTAVYATGAEFGLQ